MFRPLCLTLCCLCSALLGQGEGRPPFRTFGPEQGLKGTWTLALEQDEQGFIWAGADTGLFRGDGERFSSLPAPTSMGSVLAIACRPGGGLLAATKGGLALLDGQNLRLATPADGLPAGTATAVSLDRLGRAWVLIEGRPYRESSPGHFIAAPGWPEGQRAQDLRARSNSGTVLAVVEDRLWLGTVEGGTWESMAGPGGALAQAAQDADGRLWVRNDRQVWGATPSGAWESLRDHLPIVEAYNLELRRDGRVWASTNLGPLGLRGATRIQVPTNPLFPYVNLRSVLVDHENGLWLSCLGVQRILGRNLVRQYGSSEGLEGYTTWSLRRDHQGRLWVGNRAGLALGTPAGFRMVVRGLFLNQVDIAPDGGIWSGGGDVQRAVYRVDPNTLKAERIETSRFQEGRFSKGFAFVGGEVWAASMEQGIWSLVPRPPGWAWSPVPMPEGAGTLQFLRQDREGRIWLGTERGLYWRKGRGWEQLDSFTGAPPHSFALGPGGHIEVGLLGPPAFRRYQILGDQVQPQGAWNPLPWNPAAQVFAATLDGQGRLWLGTSQGAYRVDPRGREHPVYLSRQEGLPGNDCDQDGLLVEPSQDVWISTSAGLARYLGSQETRLPAMEAPIVTRLTEQGRPLPWHTPLTLKGNLREVELGFQVLSFDRQPRLTFEAWIEGREARWLPLNGPRLSLAGLDPGHHLLKIRAVDEDGTYSPQLELPLILLPAWWQTWWARLLGLLALGALITLLVRWRNAHLRLRNLKLKTEVAARTLELQEANVRLAKASEEKTKYLAGMSHELRTPLNAILLYSELISDRAVEQEDHQLKEDATRVNASGRHLLQLINGVLDLAKIEAGMMELAPEPAEAQALAQEALANVELLARARRNILRLDADQRPIPCEVDAGKLRQILINLLGNSVKFTEDGLITLRVREDGSSIIFEVEDTGIGMTADQMGRVFRAFEQAEGAHTQQRYGGSGLGLSLSLRLAELMGGSLSGRSVAGAGCCFILSVPRTLAVERRQA
ncbi:ATP-binding protein [Geothrix sp. PMB-07]|uniref:sensor histidine kinase n=1 Tax=Geothrix sp. PMB-07 TaxID=3068640 RepID=UPI00274186DF|nr:ATP-binding protein [Geothrix sp. PMB-07]WLT30990.1 ATP-binding protein [Geothrix sp. PMB-07]